MVGRSWKQRLLVWLNLFRAHGRIFEGGLVWHRPPPYEFGCCFSSFGRGNFEGVGSSPRQRFWELIDVISRLASAILMTLWFGIVIFPINLAVDSLGLVVAILVRSSARLGSLFGPRFSGIITSC